MYYANDIFSITWTIVYFPSITGDENIRSMLLAPTVIIQGATFDTENEEGPEFPALHATTISRLAACNAPIAIPSSLYGLPVDVCWCRAYL